MRIRAKFTKIGNVKFVGHLDTVRLFQRAIKVAGIPIAYSEGFNPHSKVYFALPLPVGMESVGEYIEIKTKTDVAPADLKDSLNAVLPKGIELLDCDEAEEGAPTLMSQVDAAIYEIIIKNLDNADKIVNVLEQPSIVIAKRNKKKKWVEQEIKPLILDYAITEDEEGIILTAKIKAGSRSNLNPELMLKAIFGSEFENITYDIKRKKLFLV
ncbi:TIGR03936 family radical SAM-associated protein [Candidatus Epulonipiscium viviparus]|uniref:TIGR03936 family radical SAM-associated protein n=1 Tax=Candidatus Epulonipiscium viviparus TaxID=420336 RepID=UPI00016C01E1|nr:TIGR03936 family radical SAM-associated protein [Candidatus Epulopiscium viviparus]